VEDQPDLRGRKDLRVVLRVRLDPKAGKGRRGLLEKRESVANRAISESRESSDPKAPDLPDHKAPLGFRVVACRDLPECRDHRAMSERASQVRRVRKVT
jgi:hypothetical protein